MRNKRLNSIIPLIVYPFDVMISLGQSDQELKKSISKFSIEWDENMKCVGAGRFILLPTNQSIIRLSDYPETCEHYGALQHEIFHCVTMVLDRIGMKFIPLKSDEAYSYLIGYLTTEVYKRI
jgi:hypothetical protein